MGAPTRRVASFVLVATIALTGVAVLPAVGGSQTDSPSALRGDAAALAARERSAVLELYGLETRLADAQARAAALRSRSEALARRQATAARRLEIARSTMRTAERLLGERVRALYERGEADPLAVVLSADSLDDALTAIDGLERAALLDSAIIAQARAARRRLTRLSSSLRAGGRELDRLGAAARAEAAALDRARSERAAYVAQLAAERQLQSVRLAQVEAAAARARELAVAAPPAAPALARAVAGSGARTGSLTVTASGYALPGTTATGVPVGWGVVAVDPSVIPLGTRMTIPGYGTGIASDTGPAVQGAAIDVWFPTEAQALAWGRRTVTIALD